MLTLTLLGALCLPAETPATVVTLGDSITRGVRAGVKANETFSAVLEKKLGDKGVKAKVVNAGIGGERTDQALARLTKVLSANRPKVVTIMYGHNDSAIDRGKTKPRLTVGEYEANLRKLVEGVRKTGAVAVLMTPPCYSKKSKQQGADENPNVQLSRYAEATRKVAKELKTPLIDHYANWHKQLDEGKDTAGWTTDLYHPNPKGHAIMAETMHGVVAEVLRGMK